ncbi:DNA repair protein rad50 [Cichlidogyrus casuarinus]|uniref:DNA repair protein rad50 n=1 Tax=Cichlidogyrus casuarinus TaxID=1844966 RepID=A0ABD2Q6N4_9PLAT
MNDKRAQLERKKEIQLQHKLKAMRGKYLDLKVRFSKTECKNKELLEQQKRHEKEKCILRDLETRNLKLREFCNEINDKRAEKEIPMLDKPMALWETYVDLKVRFDEIECKYKVLVEEQKEYEQEKCILQDLERRNLILKEICNEMNDKRAQLERKKEIVEKQCSKMQRTINDQWLRINDLKSQITEMQAQKQQQEKTCEHLLRMHQEFERKIELLEEMHNKKQERNTDMCKANLMEEATSKDLKERTSLKEMEQRCQKLEKEIEEKHDQSEISIEESIKNLDKNVSRLTKKLFKGLIKEFGSTEQVMNAALACDSSFDEAILKHLKINFWVLMIPPQKSRIARFFSPVGRAIMKPFRCCFKGSDD